MEVKRIQQNQKQLNVEEIKLLIAEYENGKSTYALARQFDCHRGTVSNVLKRHGVNVTHSKVGKLDVADIVTMYGQMHTTAEIAEKYNVGPQLILRCLREHGVKIRRRWDY